MQIVAAVSGFIVIKTILQYYGSEINGLISSINQFISYFKLIEAGLSGAAIYALYKPLAEKKHNKINGIVSAAKQYYIKIGFIFLLAVFCLAIVYPSIVKIKSFDYLITSLLVLVLGMNGVLEFFTLAKYRVLLTADQKTYVISLATIVQLILYSSIIVTLSMLGFNIVIVMLIAIFSILLRSLVLRIYVKTNYNYINYSEVPDKSSLNRRWDVLYLEILGATQRGAPIIIASIFTNLKLVSVYVIFDMVMKLVNNMLSIFNSGVSASFGNVMARGESKVLKKSYAEFEFMYYSVLAIVYSITFVTIMPFIRIYTQGITDINYDIPFIGFLFVLNGILYNIKTPQGMLVKAAGHFRETRVQSTVQALILLLFGIILSPKFGLIGILFSACLSNLYRAIDLFIYVPKKLTSLSIKSTITKLLNTIIKIFIICFPIQFIGFNPVNFVQWIFFATMVGVYGILVACIYSLLFERKYFFSVLDRLKITFSKQTVRDK